MSNFPMNYKAVETGEPLAPSRATIGSELLAKIEEISGEKIFRCMQCGSCSAGCPMHDRMDIAPNQIWKLLQMGEYEAVKNSNSIWACFSCYTCGHRCPKGIDLAKVMEAVRQLLLRKRQDHVDGNRIPQETLREVPQIALISCLRKQSG
ncbi:MAG: 4Fe-4S dicluster domain-containing protein [Candidatus Edwardsbacteria bacterium]|nr:4Fe-4S dicluster domain-containing protein [Candidatus Edwardsbacteria bacterium]